MPIAELGYRHWSGKRTGLLGRSLAIARSEVAIAYQSSRLLRRFIVFAWLPILYFCPFFLAFGIVADPNSSLDRGSLLAEIAQTFLPRESIERLREHPEISLPAIWSLAFYFFFAYTQSLFSMVAVAIVGPPLISKDLRSKAFLVYLSKPIHPWQYLLGKLSTVIFFVFSMTLFPATFLYLVGIALSPNASTLVATLPILLELAFCSCLIAVPVAMVVLLLSSITKDRKIATFLWVALWVFGEVAFRVLSVSGRLSDDGHAPQWAGLLSLRELTTQACSGVFAVGKNIGVLIHQIGDGDGQLQDSLLDMASSLGSASMSAGGNGVSLNGGSNAPLISVIVLAAISVLSAAVILRRARQQVRI